MTRCANVGCGRFVDNVALKGEYCSLKCRGQALSRRAAADVAAVRASMAQSPREDKVEKPSKSQVEKG